MRTMKKRVYHLALIFVILLAFTSVSLGATPINLIRANEPITKNMIVISGDLIVKNQTVIEEQEIIITGNIIIYNGGNLTLVNSRAMFRLRYNGEFGILVQQGGALIVFNSTITSEDENMRYYIQIF